MKTNIFFLGVLLILISCDKKEKKSSDIIVDLNVSKIDNPFSKSMSPLVFLDSIKGEFKGIINKDSSFVTYLNTVRSRDLKNAIKKGELKKQTAESTITKIYALSGFNKGKQYYIIDRNGNKDFSDDELVEFSKSITQNENYRDSFSIKSIIITKLSGGNFHNQETYLQFLPAPNYFTYEKETDEEKFKNSLQLAALKHDFLYGTFKANNDEYGVGVNNGLFGDEIIFKKSNTNFHPPNHQLFAKYKPKDTVKFDDKYFRIDSLSIYPPKLVINEINNVNVLYGFRTNEISQNYVINDLSGGSTTIKDLAKEKGFLLLDFWGTWCLPCKELTPELVNLHQKYSDDIQFASLAFELDPKPVLEYTKTNQMNWYNGIIKGKPKSGNMSSPIIGGLRIECYPTFIIMDSNLNILYRTCGGGDNYLGLKTFLKSKFE
ncbi:TlpA family protein disulfide reductase [Aestuariibaculum marinum]|uniref:TlpA family protein disulfide reductase n=1 Tax=Aestuariibaculum marinum TaxID=2683592 RepID=A0A8J6PQI7_9FLAO|nr:TlpA disulfide reductase family protein [Aestuariibaculum marinum]MBD0823025.1 TlpA family protein disulfide reductase [Aestuariibaculum marinum]